MPWLVYREAPSGAKNLLRNGSGLSEAQADARIEALSKRVPKGNLLAKLEYGSNEELDTLISTNDIEVLDE